MDKTYSYYVTYVPQLIYDGDSRVYSVIIESDRKIKDWADIDKLKGALRQSHPRAHEITIFGFSLLDAESFEATQA